VVAALGLRDETEEITPVILRLLRKEPDGPLAPDLLKTLGSLRDSRAVPYLLDYVRARYKYDVEALYALANIRDPAALNELKRIVDDPACPQRRRSAAVYSLVMTSGEGGMETLLDVIERHAELRPEVARYIWISTDSARRMVAAAAGRSPTSYRDYFRHINEAQRSWIKAKYSGKLLHDTDPYVVRGAVLLLEASKDPQAVAELRGIQGAGDPALNGLVTEAIETLSGAGKPARR
jgi:HEAT repeat protein